MPLKSLRIHYQRPDSTAVSFKSVLTIAIIAALLVLCFGMMACSSPVQGQPSNAGTLPSTADIEIFPAGATVSPGGRIQFSATVRNSSRTAALWSASAGSITSSGLFTAPLVKAAVPVTVSATIVSSGSASATVTVTPNSSLAIATNSLPSATTDLSYTAELTATGGIQPYRWALVGGSLPPGIQLNSGSNIISGITAHSGSYSFEVKATDSGGNSAEATLTVNVTSQNEGSNCGPPAYLCARTDTEALIPKAPLQLGANPQYYGGHSGAGWVAADPAYNYNRILRVTDGNTYSAFPGLSFGTGSSAEKNVSSYDESLFMVHSGRGLCLFQFDSTNFSATFRACFNNLNADFDFGYTPADQYAIYAYSYSKLYRFIINTADWTVSPDPTFNNGLGYFDPDGPSCLNGQMAMNHWLVAAGALSSDDSTVIASIGPQQDVNPYFVVWNAQKGCEWMNVQTWQVSRGWNTGMSDPVNIAFASGHTPAQKGGIHNAQLDRSGTYGVLTIHNVPSLTQKIFWTLGTNQVDDTCVTCMSHWACDFGVCFWSVEKSLAQLPVWTNRFTPNMDLAAYPPQEDSHMAHANATEGVMLPYLVSWDPDASTISGPWQDELVGVTWDGSHISYRFNKTWSSGGLGGFNTTARCSISRQGNYAICTSDYQLYNLNKGFGNGFNQDTCDSNLKGGIIGTNGCRTDVLLFELR